MSQGSRVNATVNLSDDGSAATSTSEVDESLKTRAMDEAPVGITIADATKPDMPLVYANTAFERITGYPATYAVGRNCRFLQGEATRSEPVAELRAAIECGESTSVELRNYTRDGDLFWNEVTIAPLRDEAGKISHYLGFQQDVTRRKQAEQAATRRARRIEKERTAQEHLLQRLDGVVVDVTGAVMRAETRRDLESGVVEALDDTYAGAWIGAYDPADDEVEPRAVASAGDDDIDDNRISMDGDDPTATAVAAALDDGDIHVEPTGTDHVGEPTASAAIPLHYGDAMYGVLCVYVRNIDGIDDHERAVLAALGRTVATGINALESQRALRTDEVVELRFTVDDDHPLVAFASALDCHLTYAGSVSDRDQPTKLFELTGADPGAARATAESAGVHVHALLCEESDGCLVELSVREMGFRELLRDHGAELRDATITADEGRFTVEVGRESLARSLAGAVIERFDGGELIRYQRRERRTETRREFVADLETDLTDRQHAALIRAYSSGFFEWPHEATGDEIAEVMGVCRSTFHQHLRAAERKLVGAILDR